MKVALAIVGGVLALLAITFGLNYADLQSYAFFAPRVEAVRNKTFQQSQAYNDSVVRDLENFRLEWADPKTTNDQKYVIKSTAIHRFEVYPINSLPMDLQAFYHQLQDFQ
jgi:hypothetical protein